MPWVGWLTLLGVLASAGLPPLGGFVSEWLLLQSFLFAPGLPVPLLTMLIPVVAAVIALVAALAGYTMVKFFGVIFLVSIPVLGRFGFRPDNRTLLPRDYSVGLIVALAAVWLLTTATFLIIEWRRRRA